MKIRKAVFAGAWYPETASACEKEIKSFLREDGCAPYDEKKPVGGIVPHAGWFFSGSIACKVIHCLSKGEKPDIIIIFGMHLHPDSMPYIMIKGAWETPFGDLPVYESLSRKISEKFEFYTETPDSFTQDNTIELQLPFVKYFFGDIKIIAMGVPPAKISLKIAKEITDMIKEQGLSAKVIGSTDLTHYGLNYGFAPKGVGPEALNWVRNENDMDFIKTVLGMNPEKVIEQGLKNHNACCPGAAASAILASRNLGAVKAESIAYFTSYDKHPGDSFVGYTGIVFE